MITRLLRRSAAGLLATLGVSVCSLAAAFADPPQRAAFEITHPTVTLANQCDLHAAIATLRVRAHNHGKDPSTEKKITVLDTAHALAGTADVPVLAPQTSLSIDVPLPLDAGLDPVPAKGPMAIAGSHTFELYLSDPASNGRPDTAFANVSTTIPATFCAQAIALAAPSPAPAVQPAHAQLASSRAFANAPAAAHVGVTATSAPSATPLGNSRSVASLHNTVLLPAPSPTPIGASKSVMPAAIDATSAIWPAPQGLRAVTGPYDCDGHLPGAHSFATACTNMIVSGNLVLVWTAPAPSAVTTTGYRIYESTYGASSGAPTGAPSTSIAAKGQTLVQLLPPYGGYADHCYVVTAVYGTHESKTSNVFCATANSTAKTQFLEFSNTRFAVKNNDESATFFYNTPEMNENEASLAVGYNYRYDKHTFGDLTATIIRRIAVAFNVDPYKGKRLVLATLYLRILQSYNNQSNNYSCATTVAPGIEFWWQPDAAKWLEGDFTKIAHLSAMGPVVSADVTSMVNPVLAGAPNYGFVVRNDNENLNAFQNARCETSFNDAELGLVYFDQ